METSLQKDYFSLSNSRKLLFIILCSFLTGFLWRLRGDHGWGGLAGMTAVAVGLLLTIITFFPYRKKVNFEILLVTIFMTAITNSGWGTLNSQITGTLVSSTDAASIAVSPYSGIAAMFLLGFGWAPFLALFIGFYLSDKKPKLYHFMIVICVYYAVEYITKATISHLLTSVICPDGVSAFADALIANGQEITPYKAYLAHFDNIAWAKKIAFGRNYFQTVETCSQFFASIATILYTAVFLKDRKAAKIQASVCIAIGTSITLADLFIFFADGGVRNTLKNIPSWLSGWSNWEYWTGFFTGLFIAAIICKSISDDRSCSEIPLPSLIPAKKPLRFLRNYALLCYPIVSALALPLADRLTYESDFIFRNVDFSDDKVLYLPILIITALILIYPAIWITKHELEAGNDILFHCSYNWLFIFVISCFVIYFFTGNAYILNKSMTDISITTYVSAAVILCVLFIFRYRRAKD